MQAPGDDRQGQPLVKLAQQLDVFGGQPPGRFVRAGRRGRWWNTYGDAATDWDSWRLGGHARAIAHVTEPDSTSSGGYITTGHRLRWNSTDVPDPTGYITLDWNIRGLLTATAMTLPWGSSYARGDAYFAVGVYDETAGTTVARQPPVGPYSAIARDVTTAIDDSGHPDHRPVHLR